MKKCNRCMEKKTKKEFSKNKHSSDGMSFYCKSCSAYLTNERRRRLDLLLLKVPVSHHDEFKQLYKDWESNGYPPHSKPVFINGECMTYMKSKSIPRSRTRCILLLLDKKGNTISSFSSVSSAVKATGDTRAYIKWSSDNGESLKNMGLWKIKK